MMPRGFAPKPTAIRKMEGNPGHRPFNEREPRFPVGVPEPPAGMSAAARKIWNGLAPAMAQAGVLRSVDGLAFAQLCEDQALLDTLRKGFNALAREIAKKARQEHKRLPGGPMVALSRSTEGRRTLSTIRELSAQLVIQRREFGLTPSSSTRVESTPGSMAFDPIEDALCSYKM